MTTFFALLIPVIFLLSFAFALFKKVRVFDSFTEGVKGVIPLIVSIFPYIRRYDAFQTVGSERVGTTTCQVAFPRFFMHGHTRRDRAARADQAPFRQRRACRVIGNFGTLRRGQLRGALRVRGIRLVRNYFLYRCSLFCGDQKKKTDFRARDLRHLLSRLCRFVLFFM